jgi:hypothetical protein
MTTTEYLYELDPYDLMDMKYKDALELKIYKGKELVAKLITDIETKREYQPEKERRLAKVLSAIKFNERLLNEIDVKEDW